MLTFHIVDLDHDPDTGAVVEAHWTATDTDGVNTVSAYGSVSTPDVDPLAPDFIPFASLAEANVITWVQAVLGSAYITTLQANLTAQLAELAHPHHAHGVPWVTP